MSASLFKLSNKPVEVQPGFSFSAGMECFYTFASSRTELIKALGKLEEGKVHFTFSQKWSSHELLAYILEQTGPAQVYITSWSITEDPMRKLLALVESGHITELRCLFSDRVEVMNPAAHQLMKYNQVQMHLGKCHAKVIVVRNENIGIVATGSANFTINKRWEAGCVASDKQLADEYITAINQVIKEEDAD